MAKCGCSGSTCNCVIQAGDGIDVAGAGTPASPLIISADPGDAITVADTPTVNMTKTGSVITSDVIIDPVAGNTLVAGPAGLSVPCEAIQDCVGQSFDDGLVYDDAANQSRVRLSTDGGNVLTFGTDNGVYGPASPVDIGCGLANGPGGEIIADTSATFATLTRRNCDDDSDEPGTSPLAGPDTAGMEIYCAADGSLRTKPEKFTETGTVGINEAHAVAVLPFTTSEISLSITNPSTQYCMCGYVTFAFIPAINGAPGTVIQMNHERDMGNGVFVASTGYTMDNRGKSATASAGNYRVALPIPVCLDPGETKVIRHRVAYLRAPADNGGVISITGTAREIYFVGTNL